MSTTVSQMTTSELKEMIESIMEQKLLELLGDPDEGLPIRKLVRDRLLRQKQAVAAGERGEPFEDVVRQSKPPCIASVSWMRSPVSWQGWTNLLVVALLSAFTG